MGSMQPCDLDQFDNWDHTEEDPPLRTDGRKRKNKRQEFDPWEWFDTAKLFGADPYDGTRFSDD